MGTPNVVFSWFNSHAKDVAIVIFFWNHSWKTRRNEK